MFQYTCPRCNSLLNANFGDEGKLVACPNCGTQMTIPHPDAAQAPIFHPEQGNPPQQQPFAPHPQYSQYPQQFVPPGQQGYPPPYQQYPQNPQFPGFTTPFMNLADTSKRFVALMIDWCVIYLIPFILYIGSLDLDSQNEPTDEETLIFLICVLGLDVISIIYRTIMESSAQKATLGKMATGIMVVDSSQNRITFGRSLGRNVVKVAISKICCLGYLAALFRENRQGIHDQAASTYVVEKPKRTQHLYPKY